MNSAWFHHTDPHYAGVCDFVSARIWGEAREMPLGTALGITSGERPIAGVVFNNYDPDGGVIEITAASDSKLWMTRPILFQMYSYCFDQMGCQAVMQRSDPKNRNLARMLTAYGFDRYDIPRLRGRDKAESIFILGDDVWRANGFHKEHQHG